MRIVGAVVAVFALAAGIAVATPASGVISKTKARGTHAGPLKTSIKVDDTWLKFETSDSVDVITQKITIAPGGTTGWHSHPGLNFNSIRRGKVTLYHGDDCTGETFAAGSGWFGPGLDVHVVRNEDPVEKVILYSTFVVPDGFVSPEGPTTLRIDEPAPENCPS